MRVPHKSYETSVHTLNTSHALKPSSKSHTRMLWREAWLKKVLDCDYWKRHLSQAKAYTVHIALVGQVQVPGHDPGQGLALGQVQGEVALMPQDPVLQRPSLPPRRMDHQVTPVDTDKRSYKDEMFS